MGMFDSFILTVKCPHCGEVSEIEFQTKQFRCALDVWRVGDSFDVPGLIIREGVIVGVYGGCRSKACDAWETKRVGYTSGFGRRLYCDVWIKEGKVKDAIDVRGEE